MKWTVSGEAAKLFTHKLSCSKVDGGGAAGAGWPFGKLAGNSYIAVYTRAQNVDRTIYAKETFFLFRWWMLRLSRWRLQCISSANDRKKVTSAIHLWHPVAHYCKKLTNKSPHQDDIFSVSAQSLLRKDIFSCPGVTNVGLFISDHLVSTEKPSLLCLWWFAQKSPLLPKEQKNILVICAEVE